MQGRPIDPWLSSQRRGFPVGMHDYTPLCTQIEPGLHEISANAELRADSYRHYMYLVLVFETHATADFRLL